METFRETQDRLRREAVEDMKRNGVTFEQADAAFMDMMENENPENEKVKKAKIVKKVKIKVRNNATHSN